MEAVQKRNIKTIGIIPSLYTDWWLSGSSFEIFKFSFYRTGKWRIIKIIKLFTNESKRYFEDILDHEVYDNIFQGLQEFL